MFLSLLLHLSFSYTHSLFYIHPYTYPYIISISIYTFSYNHRHSTPIHIPVRHTPPTHTPPPWCTWKPTCTFQTTGISLKHTLPCTHTLVHIVPVHYISKIFMKKTRLQHSEEIHQDSEKCIKWYNLKSHSRKFWATCL